MVPMMTLCYYLSWLALSRLLWHCLGSLASVGGRGAQPGSTGQGREAMETLSSVTTGVGAGETAIVESGASSAVLGTVSGASATAIGTVSTKVGPVSVDFLLAGDARFTVSNPKGERYTYRVEKVTATKAGDSTRWFMGLLTGPDNVNDYSYLGMVISTPNHKAFTLRLTKGSKRQAGDKAVKVAVWVLAIVSGVKGLPEGYKLHHEGRCGRCGRVLTVPESVESGIGPECAKALGYGEAGASAKMMGMGS